MLIDAFTFNNELDLIEKRLEYLYNYVDRFLIVESNYTHSGKEKPLYFENNLSRFERFKDKISLHSLLVDKTYNFSDPWNLEKYQRDSIASYLNDNSDDDLIMVSDADEIPNRDMIEAAKKMMIDRNIVRFEQTMFWYNLSTKMVNPHWWLKSYMTTKKYLIANGASHLRLVCENTDGGIHSGWHLSYFMQPEKIITKLEDFAHQELNTDYFKDISRINSCINSRKDLFDRDDHEFVEVDPNEFFPPDFISIFAK